MPVEDKVSAAGSTWRGVYGADVGSMARWRLQSAIKWETGRVRACERVGWDGDVPCMCVRCRVFVVFAASDGGAMRACRGIERVCMKVQVLFGVLCMEYEDGSRLLEQG
jgi:hypothetical protein